MCKFCRFRKIEGRPINEEIDCAWVNSESGEICGLPSKYIVGYAYVEEHLCPAHTQMEKAELKTGLADFLDAFGFGGKTRFLKIESSEDTCDYFDPLAPGSECPQKATYAKYVEMEEYFCVEHSASMGYSPGEE